jgi:hypothetical protein
VVPLAIPNAVFVPAGFLAIPNALLITCSLGGEFRESIVQRLAIPNALLITCSIAAG